MDLNKLASQIPSGAKEELLKKVDDLKATIEGQSAGTTASSNTLPESTSDTAGTDQFVEPRKPVASVSDDETDASNSTMEGIG